MAKPFAKSHIRRIDSKIRRPRAASQSYDPGQMPAVYGMPVGISASPLTIVIFELGGRFYPGDIPLWAARAGMPAPVVNTYLLPGADDSPGDADGEVGLDWQKIAEFYSYITGQAANVLIVYGPNSGSAFSDTIDYATSLKNVGAGSWSWGSPEDQWDAADLAALDASVASAPYPICAASGDNDSGDGENVPTVDCPAGRPGVVGCGGTSLPVGGQETVWNNGDGEGTGGGFSKLVSRPAWQPINSQGTGRMAPDLAMNADPNTGHNVVVNGQWQVIGGTSAVAPMTAGFLGAVNAARVKAGLGLLPPANPLLWANGKSFYDVVNGNNGAYNATVGPDPCSGLGRPLATLFAVLTGTATQPPTPPPIPPPVPPPVSSGPTEATVQAAVDALFLEHWIVTKAQIDAAIQEAFSTSSGKFVVRSVTIQSILAQIVSWIRQHGPTALPLIEDLVNASSLTAAEKTVIDALLETLLGE